ncbi:Chloroperoxidase [Lasiosphaeria miniovina]|uniref:Chloroperoxidase n=1 Tax=Lasiosphaeria miniovina TaxID=1954250 RepID=A0AA40E3X0_9PEZI|nr:Chloroperoxidase [Lasiosphaeria miniovina]KAK0723126.1 Chloroperoxidase [Lasiosphaeria miniovina]
MKLCLFVEAGLIGLAAAGPWGNPEPKGHEYHPVRPGDSRSPCPGLNVLASHGFLPRSGKNIDKEAVRSAVSAAYNYEHTTFDSAFDDAVNFKLTTTGNASTFNLADLAAHDKVEFDGSLSRNDFYFGDDLHFSPVIWATTAKRLGLYKTGPTEQDKYITIEVAAKARAARVKDAMAANPNFNASVNQMRGSPGTTALFLTTLWDDKAGGAPKAWVKAWFEEERLAYKEGYTFPAVQRNGTTIGDNFQKILAVPV